MSDMLKAQIADIKARLKADDPTAVADAAALTEQHPDEPDAWHLLAYANDMMDNPYAATEAITREMSFRPRHSALFFTRGRYALSAGDYAAAIADFTEGLALCDELKQEFYRETLHFFRAEAFVQLGRKAEARADLAHVADDCTLWTIELRTKAELVALAAE